MAAISRIRRAVKWRTDGVGACARACRATAGWERTQRVPVAFPVGLDHVPVIFCTWRRLERLPSTLAMLAAQDIPVQALIWNNSSDREIADKAVAAAEIPVTVHHSPRNIGGFGRFYVARECALAGHERVVFIDDDLDVGPSAVRQLLGGCPGGAVVSRWAWKIRSHYGGRERAGAGEAADYAGTGGMAADAAMFAEAPLFACPRQFWFVEDLWLSGYACRTGRRVLGAVADIEEVADGHNQNDSLGWVKQRLWRRLR